MRPGCSVSGNVSYHTYGEQLGQIILADAVENSFSTAAIHKKKMPTGK